MLRNLTFLGAGLLATPSAMAQEAVFWATFDGWTISIDTTIDNGCYAVTRWQDGTVLRIGLNPKEDNFYLLIGNESWGEFRPNEDYDIQIKFDSKPTWEITATGLKFFADDATYLHAENSKFVFLEEFMRQRELKLYHNDSVLTRLPLAGSGKALREMIACQRQTDQNGLPASDSTQSVVQGTGDDAADNKARPSE